MSAVTAVLRRESSWICAKRYGTTRPGEERRTVSHKTSSVLATIDSLQVASCAPRYFFQVIL